MPSSWRIRCSCWNTCVEPARCASSAASRLRDVVGMDAIEPFVGAADRGVRRQADHRAPASGDVELLRLQVPLPQAVVGAFRRERQPLAALRDLVLGARALGDVVPQQRHARRPPAGSSPARCASARRPTAAGGSACADLPIRDGLLDRRAAARCGPAPAGVGQELAERLVAGAVAACVRARRSTA